MADSGSRFCVNCGRPLVAGAAFCAGCGTRAVAPGASAATPARGAAPTSVAATMQRTVSMASRGAMLGGLALQTPWTTVVGGQADIGQLAKRWAPTLIAALPRPSLRVPALSLLFSATLDLTAAFISGQPAAMQMAGLRTLLAVVTAAFGLMTGRRGGFLRYLTTGMSAVTSLVMLVSLGRMLVAAPSNPAGWLPLLPTIVCQVASMVALGKTIVLALRKHA